MIKEYIEDAHAVVLPAFSSLRFYDVMVPFLRNGGHSILVGETRSEYVSRQMSTERLAFESSKIFYDNISRLRAYCPNLIVAVDQELGGIQRLQGLTSPLPDLADAIAMDPHQLIARCRNNAAAARQLGVTLFLAPIADVVTGVNPWLSGRNLGADAHSVSRLVSAFVTGVQQGGVAATTKHFPGFSELHLDPAVEDVSMATPLQALLENANAFRAAIEAGTKAIMVGPAPVLALDPENAACTSPAVIALLKQQFGFKGLVISDDLDAPATMRGRTLLETAIASLNAGSDLLLVAGGPTLEILCLGIAQAVNEGFLSAQRLSDAASKVRQFASAA